MLSLSTSWNAIRHQDGEGLISEIKWLGFESVEVNYQVTSEQLSQISQMQKRGEIKVASLHNIVPLPEGADPNTAHRLYPFTSPNPEVRKKGVFLARQTIDQAARLGAETIVLHLGESWEAPLIEMEKSYVNARLKSHQNKERIEEIRHKLIQSRKIYSAESLERIIECLRQLVPFTEAKGVSLGFENRYWYTQFPTSEELGILLQEFKSGLVGMWFDVGHAATQEYLGFQRKNELLEKFAGRMIGVHLMDCIRNSDHLAPGQGQYDFAHLSKYLKPDTIKVLELALYVTPEDVQAGVACLNKHGIS